jgi:hypothetical protein
MVVLNFCRIFHPPPPRPLAGTVNILEAWKPNRRPDLPRRQTRKPPPTSETVTNTTSPDGRQSRPDTAMCRRSGEAPTPANGGMSCQNGAIQTRRRAEANMIAAIRTPCDLRRRRRSMTGEIRIVSGGGRILRSGEARTRSGGRGGRRPNTAVAGGQRAAGESQSTPGRKEVPGSGGYKEMSSIFADQ